MANIHRTPAQWQQIFEHQVASGLQIATFCKQHSITPSSFYAWRKRLANQSSGLPTTDKSPLIENAQDDWVSIRPEPMATPSPWDIELALPNGVVLRMMNN